MKTRSITLDITNDDLVTIDEIAANMEVTREAVLSDAIAAYLADYAKLNVEVDEAEKAIASGNFLTQAEMESRFEARIAVTKAA